MSVELWRDYSAVMEYVSDALFKTGISPQPLQELGNIPYDDPDAAHAYLQRVDLENHFRNMIAAQLQDGLLQLAGLNRDLGLSEPIDAIEAASARFNFVENSLTIGPRHLTGLLVKVIQDERLLRPADEYDALDPPQARALTESDLKEWLQRWVDRGAPRRTRAATLAAARAVIKSRYLNDYMLGTLWKARVPARLKYSGAPPKGT